MEIGGGFKIKRFEYKECERAQKDRSGKILPVGFKVLAARGAALPRLCGFEDVIAASGRTRLLNTVLFLL